MKKIIARKMIECMCDLRSVISAHRTMIEGSIMTDDELHEFISVLDKFISIVSCRLEAEE